MIYYYNSNILFQVNLSHLNYPNLIRSRTRFTKEDVQIEGKQRAGANVLLAPKFINFHTTFQCFLVTIISIFWESYQRPPAQLLLIVRAITIYTEFCQDGLVVIIKLSLILVFQTLLYKLVGQHQILVQFVVGSNNCKLQSEFTEELPKSNLARLINGVTMLRT
ncbi:Hypothetical_protein [Hexamita inflata]|uniref:Hypothetical_protein n=1 Tax=Hexamita inflata TaxID=28002 RepID=A0AA86UW42_9EUKA|nr:Hypothetical protein HINF_LOCUS57914 [Hexamita inflata]